MAAAMEWVWANPSSVHRAGQEARHAVETARSATGRLLGVPAREITFTSSGTESIDLAIRGVLGTKPATGDGPPLIVTTKVEHAAVRDLVATLEARGEARVAWAPVRPGGCVDLDALAPLIALRPALVTIQWANNETGVVQPVAAIHALCSTAGVVFHCDGVQWIGKSPVTAPPCDLLSASPHKYHGPKGVGVLWARRGVRIRPTLVGTQESGRRAGTENVPGIVGAGIAAEEAMATPRGEPELRDLFERLVKEECPSAAVNASVDAPRLWNTSSIAFPRLEAEAMLVLLSERGVCASAGAACSSGSLEPSPVLLAMGVPEPLAHGAIRFSLSRETTRDEVERAARIVAACARTLGASTGEVIR